MTGTLWNDGKLRRNFKLLTYEEKSGSMRFRNQEFYEADC